MPLDRHILNGTFLLVFLFADKGEDGVNRRSGNQNWLISGFIFILSNLSPLRMHYINLSDARTRLLLSRRGLLLLPLEVVTVREMRIGNQVDDPFRQKEKFTAHESVSCMYGNKSDRWTLGCETLAPMSSIWSNKGMSSRRTWVLGPIFFLLSLYLWFLHVHLFCVEEELDRYKCFFTYSRARSRCRTTRAASQCPWRVGGRSWRPRCTSADPMHISCWHCNVIMAKHNSQLFLQRRQH